MAEDHPRETFTLQGHEIAEAAFEDARERGRLHHAWLLTGPEGVGKATTSSVVISIFSVIVADLLFTALFYYTN